MPWLLWMEQQSTGSILSLASSIPWPSPLWLSSLVMGVLDCMSILFSIGAALIYTGWHRARVPLSFHPHQPSFANWLYSFKCSDHHLPDVGRYCATTESSAAILCLTSCLFTLFFSSRSCLGCYSPSRLVLFLPFCFEIISLYWSVVWVFFRSFMSFVHFE